MLCKNTLDEITGKIGYKFKDSELLELALTHKSYSNEMNSKNIYGNERLEFLGDAVLDAVISHILMEKHEAFSEGALSKMRASVVNKDALANIMKCLDMTGYIILGKGEEEGGGRDKASILANVYEALIAAVYYDGGYSGVFNMIRNHFTEALKSAEESGGGEKDFKSRLQEYCQKNLNTLPKYIIESEEGPDHVKQFESAVMINKTRYETGTGKNKKAAEQNAAMKTLNRLLKDIK